MFFAPDQLPRAILAGELSRQFVPPVVGIKPDLQVVGVANVELSGRILEDVNPIHARRRWLPKNLAPETGLEPVTRRLTAGCSTIELLWMPQNAQLTGELRRGQIDSIRH